MTNDDFIDLLDQKRLVPTNLARQLRAKAASDQRITPRSILKYLVKKEIVSRAQAKELLETTLTVSAKAESSILGLAPLPDMPEPQSGRREKPSKPAAPERAAPKPVEPPPRPAAARAEPPPRVVDEPELIMAQPLFAETAIQALDPFADAAGHDVGLEDDASADAKRKAGSKKKTKRSAKERKKSEWDSPLLLLGGAGLAALVVAGVVIYYLLIRENADAILAEGNKFFEAGNYTQAIHQYERFVENYPSHEDYSAGKVRLGMSRLWQATEGTSRFDNALAVAQDVIKDIEDEPAFAAASEDEEESGLSQAKRELSSLLTTIAKGLAAQAESATDDKTVNDRIEQINTVLALTANTKYVPQRFRMDSDLAAVRDTLERVQQRQQREADLSEALAKMDQAIAAGDTAAAFAIRSALVKQYAVLVDDKALADKVLKIADAEKGVVKLVEAAQPAATDAPQGPILAELALADRRGEEADAAGAAVVRVDGAIYALNAADGALLWRRFTGLDGAAEPLLLPSGNVVAADSQRHELICLDGKTGTLLWRQALEGKLTTPVATGNRLLVGSDVGKLYVVEQDSGNLLGHVQFTQPIRQPPAVYDEGKRIFVLGEHSNLYTLETEKYSCIGVHYLGHAAGDIAAPPVVVLNKVIVADNSGAETCTLRVVALNDDGAAVNELASHRLSGLVVTPMQTAGRRVAMVTTRGQGVVFEAGAANDKSALTALAMREPQDRDKLARFALLRDGHLWVGARQLTRLQILPTGNQLQVRSLDRDYQGDAFDHPLQSVGNLVIHVRRPAGKAGVRVAASDAAASRAAWETELAVPPAGPPAVDSTGFGLTAGVASGAIYRLDREALTRRVQDRAERLDLPPGEAPTLTDSLDLAQGRLVLGGVGGERLLHFRPGNPREQLKAVELPGPLSCPPVAWRDGFVSATNVGQVTLHDADTTLPRATPFQPELTPGHEYRWLRPAVAGAGADSQLAISDGAKKIYLLTLNPQPQPHLEATKTAEVGPSPLISPLAAAGSRVVAGNDAGQLASYSLPDLAPVEPIALGGRVAWGPHTAGDRVLLATDAGELMLVAADGAIRWRQPLKHGELGGAPLVDGETALLLYPASGVARVALADGAEAAFVDLGQPAVAGPVPLGSRLVLSAADGTLLVINRP